MEFLSELFQSINKVSFGAFILGLLFLCIEIGMVIKEKKKLVKPSIRQFNTEEYKSAKEIIPPTSSKRKFKFPFWPASVNIHLLLVLLLFGMTVFFLFLSIIGFSKNYDDNKSTKQVVTFTEVQSKGLQFYSDDRKNILTDEEVSKLVPGARIIIGLQTIKDADIDRARIRVNESVWKIGHITTNFDKEKNMFYTEYRIATGETKLSVDAQLHSFADGWLGD